MVKQREILLKLFKLKKNFLNDNKNKLWDIQKNIEEDEKSAQKKEEQEKEINESSLKFNGIQNSN